MESKVEKGMERTFTIRLNEEEDAILQKIKERIDEKTDSKGIKYIIKKFVDMSNELARVKIESEKLREQINTCKELVLAYNNALKNFAEFGEQLTFEG